MGDAKRYKDLVFDLLTQYKVLRNDVNLLYLACIMKIRGREYIENTTLKEHFKDNIHNSELKKIPSMSSVIRLNTKLQKEYPNLRGTNWEEKQKHSKDYKRDLGYHV